MNTTNISNNIYKVDQETRNNITDLCNQFRQVKYCMVAISGIQFLLMLTLIYK